MVGELGTLSTTSTMTYAGIAFDSDADARVSFFLEVSASVSDVGGWVRERQTSLPLPVSPRAESLRKTGPVRPSVSVHPSAKRLQHHQDRTKHGCLE